MDLEPEGIIPPASEVPPVGVNPIVASIEAALDAGHDEEALELAEEALANGSADRLDLLFLCGDARMRLGDPAGAEQHFREVLATDPDCPGTSCSLALALFKQCRWDDAELALQHAMALPEPVPDVHVVQGLLLERRGQLREADQSFRVASKLDPKRYKAPVRMTKPQFDREVERAIKQLPKEFRKHLDAVTVIIDALPDEDLLVGDDFAEDPEILGMFDGVPLAEIGDGLMGEVAMPNYIYLFQRNIERFATDERDLIEQIRITLYHELAHYLGFDEEGVDDLGLA